MLGQMGNRLVKKKLEPVSHRNQNKFQMHLEI